MGSRLFTQLNKKYGLKKMYISGQALESTLVQSYLPIKSLVYGLGYTGGVWVTLSAIFKLKRAGLEGDTAQIGVGACIVMMLIGAALITLPSMIDMGSMTAFGTVAPSENALAYTPKNVNAAFEKAVYFFHSLSYFFNIIGMFSILRAFFIWYETTLGYRNSSFFKGFWHFVGGTIAVNNKIIAEMIEGLLSGVFI